MFKPNYDLYPSRPSPAYEGGQTGLINASPEFGVELKRMMDLQTITMTQLKLWITTNRLDGSKPITVKELFNAKCITRVVQGVSLSSSVILEYLIISLIFDARFNRELKTLI